MSGDVCRFREGLPPPDKTQFAAASIVSGLLVGCRCQLAIRTSEQEEINQSLAKCLISQKISVLRRGDALCVPDDPDQPSGREEPKIRYHYP